MENPVFLGILETIMKLPSMFFLLGVVLLVLLHPLIALLLFITDLVRFLHSFFLLTFLVEAPQRKATYGRLSFQDYTKESGKIEGDHPETEEEKKKNMLHALLGQHPRYAPASSYLDQVEFRKRRWYTKEDRKLLCKEEEKSWSTKEDREWLQREREYREIRETLQKAKIGMRASAKAIIPILGLFWVGYTETQIGGGSMIGCVVCQLGGEDDHWHWSEAIQFHLDSVLS